MKRTTQSKKQQLKNQKCQLFARQRGLCYYCKRPMVLSFEPPTHRPPPKNLATFEHLDDRFSLERGKHGGEYRKVLACYSCNNKKGAESQAQQAIEILRERAGQHPLTGIPRGRFTLGDRARMRNPMAQGAEK